MSSSSSLLHFPSQSGVYSGKVRDVYYFDDKVLLVASDRISAFDHILPKTIPYKGAVLTGVATYFLEQTADIVPNWLQAVPAAHAAWGLNCEPIKIEMVIRGYLAGHAWREYKAGRRSLCGVPLPKGLKESDRFPEPIITPATKADEGHDEDISKADILKQKIVTAEQWSILEKYTRSLFKRGQQMAEQRGLILVDTKYEFGLYNDQIILIDEVHTPDSSRYFIKEGYQERQEKGQKQAQLSKEFVREWLMEKGFQGLEGQQMPEMEDSFVQHVSNRYIELYERLTGTTFVKSEPISDQMLIEQVEKLVSEKA